MKEEILNKCNSSDILSRTVYKDNLVIDIIYCETLTDSSLIEKYICPVECIFKLDTSPFK